VFLVLLCVLESVSVDISAAVEGPAGDADPDGVRGVAGGALVVGGRTLNAAEGEVAVFSTPLQMWTLHGNTMIVILL